jgi:ApeA N-terminal domain 1/Apea-like HEPN
MDAYSAEGVWWRPEAPQHRVPGTLTSDEDGVELVVYGPLRPSIPSKGGVVKIEGSEWVATPAAHGRTRDGADITLLDVGGLMSLPVPSAEVRETHTVSVACIGGHFSEDAFIQARAEFDWLDAWLDPPPIVDDNVTGSPDETVVRVARSELARAEIAGGTVRLITGVAGREGPSAIHLDRRSAVSIDLNEPQPWRTILDSWIRPFHDLLTISIGRPVRLTELRLRPADAAPRAPLSDARFGMVQAQRKATPSPQALLKYTAPTLVTRRNAGVPLEELLTAWYQLWVREREAIMHLLAPFHASFMYSQHKFGAAFQAVEALHHKPRFTGRELDGRSHQQRVAAIVRAARAAGVKDDTVAWAARVLRSRNDKPLTKKIEDVVRSAGACGDAVLKAAPTFPSTVAGERAGVSHPGVGRNLGAADRYWHGEVLTWIVRTVLLAAAGVNDVDRRTVARAAFQHAVEQLGPTVESVSGSG